MGPDQTTSYDLANYHGSLGLSESFRYGSIIFLKSPGFFPLWNLGIHPIGFYLSLPTSHIPRSMGTHLAPVRYLVRRRRSKKELAY